jgi:hypothetical protein
MNNSYQYQRNEQPPLIWKATSDKVYQLLAHGRWFCSGTPASSTTKTGRHDIAEILLIVALNTKNQSINLISNYWTQKDHDTWGCKEE